jgi:hypothetical protein
MDTAILASISWELMSVESMLVKHADHVITHNP